MQWIRRTAPAGVYAKLNPFPMMSSVRVSLNGAMSVPAALLVLVSVLMQHAASVQHDWHMEINIKGLYNITMDSNTLHSFYRCLCRDSAVRCQQPFEPTDIRQGLYKATPMAIDITNGSRDGYNFMCVAGSGGALQISCDRRSDAVTGCWQRSEKDCRVFHVELDGGVSSSCREKCFNVAWIGRGVSFGKSPSTRSNLPVFSEGLCPNHPSAKTRTVVAPSSTTSPNVSSSGKSDTGGGSGSSLSNKAKKALIIAAIVVVVIIAAVVIVIVCCRRRREERKHEKRTTGVQTDPHLPPRTLSRPSFRRIALLSKTIFGRAPSGQPTAPAVPTAPEPDDDDVSSASSPIYYEISSESYEEPLIVRQQGEGVEPNQEEDETKNGDHEYRKLHPESSGMFDLPEDKGPRPYGKFSGSTSGENPPDLVPDSERPRDYRPVIVPVSNKPDVPPKPKPRDRISQKTTLKIRS